MKVKVEVLIQEDAGYSGKQRRVEQDRLVVLDVDREHRFLQTFDFMLNGVDYEKYHGTKLAGKVIEISISAIAIGFGGRIRSSGSLLSVT